MAGRATLHELQTVYGIEGLYDLLEIARVDAYNSRLEARATEANS